MVGFLSILCTAKFLSSKSHTYLHTLIHTFTVKGRKTHVNRIVIITWCHMQLKSSFFTSIVKVIVKLFIG
jgi:hypothetical protein